MILTTENFGVHRKPYTSDTVSTNSCGLLYAKISGFYSDSLVTNSLSPHMADLLATKHNASFEVELIPPIRVPH